MKTTTRIALILAVVVLASLALVARQGKNNNATESKTVPTVADASASTGKPGVSAAVATAKQQLPKLLDLGAGKCIPCKMMAPILESMKKEYAGKMDVDFIDVWQNPDAGKAYGIEMIPTQIFYDASGKELFRHTGFYGKEDILGKWKELGVDIGGKPAK